MSVEGGQAVRHYDVLIVGAGISGIGAGYYLRRDAPDRSFLILESKSTFGGTWITHRFPGIRSDSDLFTFGYRFKPWTSAPIARAEEICRYLGEVIEEADLQKHIRYGHRIEQATWSSADNRWTVTARRVQTGEVVNFTAGFLWMCQGYFRHDQGYTPEWPGMRSYRGRIVHPQTWPTDLDLTGKQVLVIGSGATAATLIPNIANECAHVTMVQRSPTYFWYATNSNGLADKLRSLQIDERWIHEIVRRAIVKDDSEFIRQCFEDPAAVRRELLASVRSMLGDELTEKHFSPRYWPWRQRVAFIPDADFFHAIKAGKVSIETAEIERFTEDGLLLKSGKALAADVIVTATGFNMCMMGDIAFKVDGKPINFGETITYRGMMFTGVPNVVHVFGYTRASWTLRLELVANFVCRLLNHMSARGAAKVEVALRPQEAQLPKLPWVDPENFSAGYMMRSLHLLPMRLAAPEWRHTNDYLSDQEAFPMIDLDASEFVYDRAIASGMPRT